MPSVKHVWPVTSSGSGSYGQTIEKSLMLVVFDALESVRLPSRMCVLIHF